MVSKQLAVLCKKVFYLHSPEHAGLQPSLPPSLDPSLSLSLQTYSICIRMIGFEKAIQQKPSLPSHSPEHIVIFPALSSTRGPSLHVPCPQPNLLQTAASCRFAAASGWNQ